MKKRNSRKVRQGEALPNEKQISDGMVQVSMFGVETYSPKVPKSGTRAYNCLQMLLAGERLSQPRFLECGQGWRLSAAVHALNLLGWPDERRDLRYDLAKHPIKEYWFSQDVIAMFSRLVNRGNDDEKLS